MSKSPRIKNATQAELRHAVANNEAMHRNKVFGDLAHIREAVDECNTGLSILTGQLSNEAAERRRDAIHSPKRSLGGELDLLLRLVLWFLGGVATGLLFATYL